MRKGVDMLQHLSTRLDLFAALVLFVGINLLTAWHQEPLTYHGGLGWDGVYYAKITRDLAEEERPQTRPPFVYRLGVPLLASALGPDILTSWRYIGLAANLASLVLLYVFLCLYFDARWLRFLLLLLILLPFDFPVRRVWFSPISTDYVDKVFLIGSLIMLKRVQDRGWQLSRAALLGLMTFTGVLVREIVGVVGLAALFVHNPMRFERGSGRIPGLRLPSILALIPLAAALLGGLLVKMIASPTSEGYFLRAVAMWLTEKGPIAYLQGWCIAFGPILVLPLYYWRDTLKSLLTNQHLSVFLGCFTVLGWIGGSATYRLLHWTIPVVFLLVGRSIRRFALLPDRKAPFLALLASSYLVSQRVFWLLPDHPGGVRSPWVFLTPLNSGARLLDVIGVATSTVQHLVLLSHLVLFLALFWLLRRAGAEVLTPDGPPPGKARPDR